jgi:hypothetical protein
MIAAYGPYAASATGGNGLARDFLAGIAAMYATPCMSTLSSASHMPGCPVLTTSLRECRRPRLPTSPRVAYDHPRYSRCDLYYPNLRFLLQRTMVPRAIQVRPVPRWRKKVTACTGRTTPSGCLVLNTQDSRRKTDNSKLLCPVFVSLKRMIENIYCSHACTALMIDRLCYSYMYIRQEDSSETPAKNGGCVTSFLALC